MTEDTERICVYIYIDSNTNAVTLVHGVKDFVGSTSACDDDPLTCMYVCM